MSANVIAGFVGMKGVGKTYRLRTYARRARRLIVLDPEAKWQPWRGDAVVSSAAELRELARAALEPRRRLRVVCRADAGPLGEWGPAIAFVTRNLTLAVDEAAWFCTPYRLPEWFSRLFQFGRERRINLLWTTRDPQELHRFFFSQADVLHLYRVQPGAALDVIRKRYGRELGDQVSGLRPRVFRTYGNPRQLELIGREGLDSAG